MRPRIRSFVRLLLLVFGMFTAFATSAGAADDWPTYAHDDRRTGFQPAATGITRNTAGSLQLHWSVALGETVTSSPVVADGTVFVATESGNVVALDADSGRLRWKHDIGLNVRMTPAVSHGRLLVAVYGTPGTRTVPSSGASLQALDPASGHVLWNTPLPGVVRGEPLVIGNVIYEGIAGGDPDSGCLNGRIVTVDERTGKMLPGAWYTSSIPRNGGGIWSPLSYDGKTIFFGTGNTCDNSGPQDAIVAISPALRMRWSTPGQAPGGEDEDVGGGAMILGALAYVEGKSGVLYALDRRTGKARWTADTHASAPGGGGFATPAGDGTILVVNSGDGSSRPPNRTRLVAFDLSGKERYSIKEQIASTPSLGASFVRGVGFASIDKSVLAFEAQTGATLWRYPTADAFYGVPAIVPSGVYAVDLSGNVYAFGLGAAKNASPKAAPLKVEHDADREIVVGPPTPGWKRIGLLAVAIVVVLPMATGLYILRRGRRR